MRWLAPALLAQSLQAAKYQRSKASDEFSARLQASFVFFLAMSQPCANVSTTRRPMAQGLRLFHWLPTISTRASKFWLISVMFCSARSQWLTKSGFSSALFKRHNWFGFLVRAPSVGFTGTGNWPATFSRMLERLAAAEPPAGPTN